MSCGSLALPGYAQLLVLPAEAGWQCGSAGLCRQRSRACTSRTAPCPRCSRTLRAQTWPSRSASIQQPAEGAQAKLLEMLLLGRALQPGILLHACSLLCLSGAAQARNSRCGTLSRLSLHDSKGYTSCCLV